jgi:hypothetical protein
MAEDLDRGDDFVPTDDDAVDTSAVDDKAVDGDDKAVETDDNKATDDGDDKGGDDKATDDKDDQPRDKGGKFAKKGGDDKAIPKARVDEMIRGERERAEAAEAKMREMEKQIRKDTATEDTKKLETEITDLEKKHAKAILDGNSETAAELAGQIRLKERQIQIGLSKGMSAQAKEEAREEIRLDLTIERLQVDYPMLNEEDEAYDQDAVDMVLATQQQYIRDKGMTPSVALARAAAKVMGKLNPAKVDDDKDAKDSKGLDKAKEVEGRSKAQLDKNIDTSKKQPADTKAAGLDSDKKGIKDEVDASKLSYEEFAALPEATKARLRGDLL